MTSEYRRGVEDGTRDFRPEEWRECLDSCPEGTIYSGANMLLRKRRKSLLTKTVPKWIILYTPLGFHYEPTVVPRLFDTKEAAETYYKREGVGFAGALNEIYPIQVEVPVD